MKMLGQDCPVSTSPLLEMCIFIILYSVEALPRSGMSNSNAGQGQVQENTFVKMHKLLSLRQVNVCI